MRLSRLASALGGTMLAVTTLLLSTLILSRTAHADPIISSQSDSFFGIDDSGAYVVNLSANYTNPCGTYYASCFATYYPGNSNPVYSSSAPALSYDDGYACDPVLFPGLTPMHGVCNDGHAIVGGFYDNQFGIWNGPDPVADLIDANGSFDGGDMNANGEVVFIDGRHDTLDVAGAPLISIAPEPNSLILLGTGCISMLVTFRRFRYV
jgi:hypothetical protein